MSTKGFIILLIIVAVVALYGGYLIGSNSSVKTELSSSSASELITPTATPLETNVFDSGATSNYENPLDDVILNPFAQ